MGLYPVGLISGGGGGGLISEIISLLANRRAYNLGGFDVGFYGM